ncbi:hypothetical protein CIB84_000227 [Bambusicola thoracicus]|uniref:Uncharacterized protein n=1 Tax=Bambusicola thoracicus TaxID=9083 RepID=A0A2P4TI29_BAMTH|nr:hypothetical protein CIB84_000227 [Bambusicola thoracicus]
MIIVTVGYVLTNVAYFTTISAGELLLSKAVAVTFAERLMGSFSLAVPVFVALSCFGSMNGGIFAVSRMFFVASREGHLPEILSMIHVRKHTPLPAVIVLVPLFIPALFSFTCLFMVALSLYSDPVNTGIGFAITLTGVPAYYLFIVWDKKPKWFRKLLVEFHRSREMGITNDLEEWYNISSTALPSFLLQCICSQAKLAIENANADCEKVLRTLKNPTTKEFAQQKALEWKPSELSNSKQSLQTLSLCLIHHRRRRSIKPPGLVVVSVWEQELRKLLLRRRLVFGLSFQLLALL